jgi:hypothetical protein
VEVGTASLVAYGRRDDLTFAQRGAVVDRDDANDVIGVLDDHWLESVALRDHIGHLRE